MQYTWEFQRLDSFRNYLGKPDFRGFLATE